MRAAVTTLVLGLALVLAGCGGSGDGSDTPAATTGTASSGPGAPAGEPAPEALSRFRCERNGDGVWNASGYLTNPAKSRQSFQVTVFIGEANGDEQQAKTQLVENVGAEGSVAFRVTEIPAPDAEVPCHVQVLKVS